MFERFTEPARQVVVLAQEEARILRHPHIGTEHLLLGIVRAEPPLVPVPIATARDRVEALRGRGNTGGGEDAIPFTPEAKAALEAAAAIVPGEDPVAPAHVLLGLLDAEHTVAELLADLGLEPARVREDAEAAGAVVPLPSDPLEALRAGGPVTVRLGEGNLPMGDFGNRRVDARLLLMLRGDTPMGRWLRARGVDEAAVLAEVPGADERP